MAMFGLIFIVALILGIAGVVMLLFEVMVNLAYIFIATFLLAYGIGYIMYQSGKRLMDYHSLIPNEEFQRAAMLTQFDTQKPIIFVPEQFIGVCIGTEFIPTNISKEEKANIIYMLSKSYNVFLKLSNLNIKHKDIATYCKYIFDHNYPICFIVNKFPPSDVLTDISFNDGKYWLTVFDQRNYYKLYEEK